MNGFIEAVQHSIDPGAYEPGLCQVLEFFLKLSLSSADDRRQNHDAFALRQRLHMANNLIRSLLRNRLAAVVAVRDPYGREEQPEIVVNFGDGPYRRTGT